MHCMDPRVGQPASAICCAGHTGKELRKDAFAMAQRRYDEVKPILDELAEIQRQEAEELGDGPKGASEGNAMARQAVAGSRRRDH